MATIYKDNYQPIAAKTAAYTLVPGDVGKLFTNRGASGAVTFTLPKTGDVSAGWWAEFFVVADQTITVASNEGDNMILFNDAAADSLAFSTASEKVGGGLKVVFDGTSWLGFVHLAIETQTPVVAT